MDFIRWKEPAFAEAQYEGELSKLPRFVRQIMRNRGLETTEQAEAFLSISEEHPAPMLLKGMAEAVACLRQAVEEGWKILIYGDYDCDGICSTVMLYDYLESEGADVLYYIPDREKEGYGLNETAIRGIAASGVELIVTVDNGISAQKEIRLAKELGVRVIVTDHHHISGVLPEAEAVINPHREDSEYPFRDLCGAGVAFQLICALEDCPPSLMMSQYGDLVALATVADAVPLTGENRYLVSAGLAEMADGRREGFRALAAVSGISLETMTAEQLAFSIAPRINATGRMCCVDQAVELFLCQEPARAEELARALDGLNQKRKELEAGVVQEIAVRLAAEPKRMESRILILDGRNWHTGIIGIIAARLTERYRKPCIIFSDSGGGELRGSGRSVEGFSLIEAIDACSDCLLKYGGHPMAAGVTLREENLEQFRQEMEQYSRAHYPDMPEPACEIDAYVEPSEIGVAQIRAMERLAPFGSENRQPVLGLSRMTVTAITPMASGRHLRLTLSRNGMQVQAVWFGVRPENLPVRVGEEVDCAVSLSVNCYREQERPSVRVLNLHPYGFRMEQRDRERRIYLRFLRGEELGTEISEPYRFSRDAMGRVFRWLRKNTPYRGGLDSLYHRMNGEVSYFQLRASMEILCELGLLSKQWKDGAEEYAVIPVQGKANIPEAPLYQKLAVKGLVRE